jgi:hypothetical protein
MHLTQHTQTRVGMGCGKPALLTASRLINHRRGKKGKNEKEIFIGSRNENRQTV